MRAILWSDLKPEDVHEEAVEYRGRKRRYAQLRFGSPNSTRIVVVLDEVTAAEGDLYVDANRDRHLTPAEKVAGSGPRWRVPLRVEHVVEDTFEYEPRAIVLRRGTAGLTLGLAAVGFWEGRVRLGDRDVSARRVDADGNGLFADPLDRLWIDLNDDGQWDAGREQFLFAPLLMLNGSRFAVRGEVHGRRLTLEPITGTGTLRLAWTGSNSATVIDLTATLVGRDGSAATLSGNATETTLPSGDYRVSSVSITLRPTGGEEQWAFHFSDRGRATEPRWHTIAKDAALTLDPLGDLKLGLNFEGSNQRCRAGELVLVQPQLITRDGLTIVSSTCRPKSTSEPHGGFAELQLAPADGEPLATARSGFT